MIDIPFKVGGAGWKSDGTVAPTPLSGAGAGVIYSLNPGAGKIVRVTLLAVWATSGSVPGLTLKMGARDMFSNKIVGSQFSTSGTPDIVVGNSSTATVGYYEGKDGETVSLSSGPGVGAVALYIGVDVGEYV